ncbi:MAG: hypothetical protein ACT4ON_01775 [Bacteroidota bacterium]
MKLLKSAICMLMAISIFTNSLFANKCISVEDAAKKGLVKLSIKSRGGFTGEVIEMNLQNNTNQKLDLNVEAGRRLDSKNNSEQDILVTRSQEFFVNGKQSKTLMIYGMCCQAHNSSPKVNSIYSVGKLADSNLVKLANFLDTNKYYTNDAAQDAVWAVSDNESLGSIIGDDKKVVDALRKYVSEITGRPIPAYDIIYKQESDRDVMGRANRIEGVFEYSVPADGSVTIGIYDEQGRLVQLLFQDITHEKGECKLYYTFRTREVQPGTYYARMNMNGMLQKEMKIEF